MKTLSLSATAIAVATLLNPTNAFAASETGIETIEVVGTVNKFGAL